MKISINPRSSFSFKFVGKYDYCEVTVRSSENLTGYLVTSALQQQVALDIQQLNDTQPFFQNQNRIEQIINCVETPCMILVNRSNALATVEITVNFFPMNFSGSHSTSGFGI